MTERLRQSVPSADAEQYWTIGWTYLMPDFDKPGHSIVEWSSEKMPVYPAHRVPEASPDENASHERTEHRA